MTIDAFHLRFQQNPATKQMMKSIDTFCRHDFSKTTMRRVAVMSHRVASVSTRVASTKTMPTETVARDDCDAAVVVANDVDKCYVVDVVVVVAVVVVEEDRQTICFQCRSATRRATSVRCDAFRADRAN